MVHLIPVLSSMKVDLTTQSPAMMNNKADITHPCHTPGFTRKLVFKELPIVHFNSVWNAFTMSSILNVIP